MIDETLLQIDSTVPTAMLGFGLIIGFFHALEADHVSAVSTQAIKSKTQFQNHH